MKKISTSAWLLISLILCLGFSACDKEKIDYNTGTEEQGQLSFAEFSFSVDTKEVITKAATDNYVVNIHNSSNVLVESFIYSKMPSIVPLKVGTYSVTVQSKEKLEEAGWNIPFYAATKSIQIEKDKVASLGEIVCTLKNVKISITVDAASLNGEVKEGYTVQVSNGGLGIMTFTKEDMAAMQSGSKYPYFKADKSVNMFTIKLIGERMDGQRFSESTTISGVKGGEWRKITLSVVQTGTLKSTLKVDSNMEVVSKEVDVPVEDDIISPTPTPDPEDPEEPEKPVNPSPGNGPTIEGGKFDFEFPIGDTETVIVNVNAPAGIASLTVDIESDFLTEEFLSDELIGLSTHFDLAAPGRFEDKLVGLGLLKANDPVKGKTALKFDISSFTPLLLEAGAHKFHLKVTDANGLSASKTLTLTTTTK